MHTSDRAGEGNANEIQRLAGTEAPARALRWIWRTSKKRAPLVAVLALAQVLIGLSGVCMAFLLKELIDYAVAANTHSFIEMAFALVALVVLQAVLQAVDRYASELTRASLENAYKNRLVNAALLGDYECVSAVHSGEWMNRLTNDAQVVANGVAEIIPGVLSMVAKLAGAMALLAFMLPQLALLLVIGGLAVVAASYVFRKTLKKLHRRIQEADGRFRILVMEGLSNLAVIRAFSKERDMVFETGQAMDVHKCARMQRNRFWNMCNIGFSLAINGAYVIGAIWCGWGIMQGVLSYGTFVAVVQLVSQIQSPIANISSYVPRFYAMTASAERLMELEYDCHVEIVEKRYFPGNNPNNPNVLDNQDNSDNQDRWFDEGTFNETCDFDQLCLNDVTFAYHPLQDQSNGGLRVLNHFTMTVRKEECAVLVGASGAGKSTILKLLLGLYHPEHGTCQAVLNNGLAAPLDRGTRQWFAYVPQGNGLMQGTIRACLAFGDAQAMKDQERLDQALWVACAEDFVQQLPHGMDTELGEHGSGLSEGQMQRLAIARSVFSGRRVLLLDECTSALDESTEREVLSRLKQLEGRTIIMVTHRPAALALADQVIHV